MTLEVVHYTGILSLLKPLSSFLVKLYLGYYCNYHIIIIQIINKTKPPPKNIYLLYICFITRNIKCLIF